MAAVDTAERSSECMVSILLLLCCSLYLLTDGPDSMQLSWAAKVLFFLKKVSFLLNGYR